MKKPVLLAGALAVMMTFSITACGSKEAAPKADDKVIVETETETEAETEAETETKAEKEALEVAVENAEMDYEHEGQVLGDPDEEYAAHILFTVNQPVSEIGLYTLAMDITDDGELTGGEDELISDIEYLEAGESLLICGELGETIPTKGIMLKDAEGTIHHYYLELSGMDGSALITEYNIE